MKRKIILMLGLIFSISILFISCKEEKLDDSIFDIDIPELNPNSFAYKFDKFLVDNFRKPYNCRFIYRMEDVGTDMQYNLIPATLTKSKEMAVLTKDLWFDVYKDKAGDLLLKNDGIRILFLVGSAAFDPYYQTEVPGYSQSGIKITLYNVNGLKINDIKSQSFFQTMHREFTNVLTSKTLIPREFNYYSVGLYLPNEWQNYDDKFANMLGFVTNYAMRDPRTDFAETIAKYIVSDDGTWNMILYNASLVNLGTEDDPIYPFVEVILKKLALGTKYLRESWGYELDAIRDEVLRKQSKVNVAYIDSLFIRYDIN